MEMLYNLNDLDLGRPTQSGHEVYLDAVYKPNSQKIIYKKNKHNNPQFSRLEVVFSQLALLFLGEHLTSSQRLVVNDAAAVQGLVVEHLCYVIAKKEGLTNAFYTLKEEANDQWDYKPQYLDNVQQIPIYFLDKLPQDFFSHLLNTEKEHRLTINYESLASILTCSYTLEEDDLHRGNFGFYLRDKQGIPEVVFFKIDHDLMFVDSIMSFCTRRPYHIFHGGNAFDIKAEDLLNFPHLIHSANSYWPTKLSHLSNPWDNKEYHSQSEVNSFAQLQYNPAFIKAKWLSFYKHTLLPTQLIELSLTECLDKNNASNRAQIALMVQATVARQARLRAMLFSLKEFREFVLDLTQEEHFNLMNEVLSRCPASHQNTMLNELGEALALNKELCLSGFTEGDTPLHTAIKLGDFRYEETMQMYGHLVNKKNSQGQTALDVAVEKSKSATKRPTDIRQDTRLTMRYLLAHGAHKTDIFNSFNEHKKVETYQFHTQYLKRVTQAKSYSQFKEILRDIGEDASYCLKFKKNLAIRCVTKFIEINKNTAGFREMLITLKNDINNNSSLEEHAGLKYIRQLRSRLWIIRQIRGLFGWTSTQSDMNTVINNELKSSLVKALNSNTFFDKKAGASSLDDTSGLAPST
jgi:hypothetical protein